MAGARGSSLGLDPISRKKYVSRACDACRKRKSKCDGGDPCRRCVNSDLDCTYELSHNRHKRRAIARSNDTAKVSSEGKAKEDATGDPSVHGFLRRASDHLAQIGQGLPRNLFNRDQDGYDDDCEGQAFVLPERSVAESYVRCFFEHALVTYRYVYRKEVERILREVYADDGPFVDHDRMALLVLVMGIGCLWTASWRGEPLPPWRRKAQRFLSDAERRLRLTSASFPPLKCNLELGSRRFNSAWMTLGVAVRLGQMMDLHREQSSTDPVEAHYRRCAFWAMFVLDRYLAVLLGRPLAMHEGDITVALPTEVNAQLENEIGSWEKKLLTGVTAHTGLSRITGHAISLLYSGTGHNSNDIEDAVTTLEKEMDDWLQVTPQFFHPNRDADTLPQSDFYDVPWTLQRQQRTVQAAFYFNQMLIYRGYLLGEFLRQSANIPLTDRHFERIRACVDSALATVMLTSSFGTDQSKYNAAFWTTSHILFCATSVLLVYLIMVPECADRPQIESSIEKAMKVHAKLVDNSNNTAQRLLEESRTRAEAIQKMSSVSPANASDTPLLDWATLNPELPNDTSSSRSLFAQQPQRQDNTVPLSNVSTSLARGSQANTDVDKTMGNGQIPKQITELWGQNLGLAPFGNTNDLDMILGIGFDSHMFSIGLGEDDVEYS